ncbi:MAG: carboxymuconolactone decarboxylase family protein [Acidiferrobacterales bacterium]
MDKKTIELIAVGASAAANCRPCMDYHFAAGRKLGVSDEDLHGALEVGIRVNQGAGKKTVDYIREHLGQNVSGERKKGCCG